MLYFIVLCLAIGQSSHHKGGSVAALPRFAVALNE